MYALLAQSRIQRVIEATIDIRQYPDRYQGLNAVPDVDAYDAEIFARFKDRVVMADIISANAKAPIKSQPEVALSQSILPYIKHGYNLTREELRILNRIENNLASTQEITGFINAIGRNLATLLEGVRARQNWMTYGMWRDNLTYANKNGIQITALTFGMPSDLKITLSGTALWSAPTTATPITNLNTIKTLAMNKYGKRYNYVRLSQAAFDLMIRTTEFTNLAAALYAFNGSNFTMPLTNLEEMVTFAGRVGGYQFIIDDTQAFEEANSGAQTSVRNLPASEVIMGDSADIGDARVWDFANAEVEEAMPGMVPAMIGAPTGGPRGPFGYATAADPQGNPPGMNLWGVKSGMPRKHVEAANARIIVSA